jgi:hypothetical protein
MAGPVPAVALMAEGPGTAWPILRATPNLGHFDIHVPLIKIKKTQVILVQFIVLKQKKPVLPVNAISNSEV